MMMTRDLTNMKSVFPQTKEGGIAQFVNENLSAAETNRHSSRRKLETEKNTFK